VSSSIRMKRRNDVVLDTVGAHWMCRRRI